MGTLEGFFQNAEIDTPWTLSRMSSTTNPPQLSLSILSLIKAVSTDSCGVGRTTLLQQLKKVGIKLSDAKLREELAALKQNGYITVSRGRTGCQITLSGIQRLKELKFQNWNFI